MPEIIRCENLVHTYSMGTPFERRALDGVDIAFETGSFTGLIGHTGSGKSTLVQHLNGLLKPSSGKIYLDGQDIWQNPKHIRSVRFKVGLVFQYPEYQLFEETVYKDIAFGPKNSGLSDADVRERVMEAVEFVRIDESLLEKSPFELSGGQKRRIAIAGVIAMQPDVLILDEPTAGLDPHGRDEILDHIAQYHRARGKTVILVTHNMEDIARVAERIVVMSHAKIAMSGTPAEIFSRATELDGMGLSVPQVTRVFLRLKAMGLPLDTAVYTVAQATAQLLTLKGTDTHA